MKKPVEKPSVGMRTIESDLKKLFESERLLHSYAGQDAPQSAINLEQAVRLFDELRATRAKSNRQLHAVNWSHPSVVALNSPDPVGVIIDRARQAVFAAVAQGWDGPPYNPFKLAELRGMKLSPNENVLEARTRSDSAKRFTIEFNPQKTAARMRYSIAHEIGHTLFADCANEIRNRATHQQMANDDWQLEALCNIAAAEILMPFGTLQEEISIRPSIGLVLELRRKYLVSSEAMVNRLIRLTTYPCFAFIARCESSKSRYFVEYNIPSQSLNEQPAIYRGYVLPQSSKASECIAIGTRQQEDAVWVSGNEPWFIEYLGISPNPGEFHPRVLGLAFPQHSETYIPETGMTFVKGDVTEPIGAEPKLLLQLVNDQALFWGGGVAKQAGKKWPRAQESFRKWAYDYQNRKLGNIHSFAVRPDLTLVSLVSQHGLGKPKAGPRLRYGALLSALEKVATLAKELNASVHMPRIGTGEAGGSWNIIKGIIQETLISRRIKVTIYLRDRNDENLPRQSSLEFSKEIVDEVF